MIRKPTLVIFGAGVSSEYGFPLGRSLLLEIVRELEKPTILRQSMEACGFNSNLIVRFQRELNGSGQPSVDAFLEAHQKDPEYERLGKAAIAASLIPKEVPHRLYDRSSLKLYEHLWHQMSATPNTYSSNQLSILTFNYDRSFEQYLYSVLEASHPEFRDRGQPLRQAFSSFDVIHIYGSLGALERDSPSHLAFGGQDYPLGPGTILSSADRIKLYHQAQFDDNTLERIKLRIGEAERICFLGFGFYPVNIRILKFCGLGENKNTKHFASAFGLKEGERESIRRLLGFTVEFTDAKSLDAIRTFPVLISS